MFQKHSKSHARYRFKSTSLCNTVNLQKHMVKGKLQSEKKPTTTREVTAPHHQLGPHRLCTADFLPGTTEPEDSGTAFSKGYNNCPLLKIIVTRIVHSAKLPFKNKDKIFKQTNINVLATNKLSPKVLLKM